MTNKYLTVMNRFLLALALCLFSIAMAKSQDLEGEIEFNYIKAKYLLDTERYEDAIKAFTKLLEEDSNYKDALLLRAQSKYAMAAYRGTKKDVLLFAANNGMNTAAVTLLGKADYKMGNNQAAINSLGLAVSSNSEDAQVSEFLGNLYEKEDQLLKACKYWQKSASMGSSKSRIKAKNMCGMYEEVEKEPEVTTIDDTRLPDATDDGAIGNDDEAATDPNKMKNNTPPSTENDERTNGTLNNPTKDTVLKQQGGEEVPNEQTEDENTGGSGVSESYPDDDNDPIFVEEVKDPMPEEDNTPNEIEIDEDLTLVIRGQGLGKRKILDQPNILILSDTDGVVAVDICVNKRGKVESAEFNSKLSTIAKKSLVSLAIRKSKDFWFEKNDYKEQCGVIIFKITAS